MTESIGKAQYELSADRTQLVTDLADSESKIVASGDRMGVSASHTSDAYYAAGQKIGAGLLKVKSGAQEAEAAQGKWMAATGGSREEAAKFVSGMDSLAGSAGAVGKSFEDIAATGTMVEQQFGTTGQKTTDLTAHILEFAKVTGQDATQAAAALEDTLTAFGLSSDDAALAMDKLVKSNQDFGTSAGPASVAALNDMAPALTAMGMGLDDGIELLNAFEVAGADAGDAAKGLKTAVAQLEPGQNIDDLIVKIAAIEDPMLKNAAATEAFGKKMGPDLAKLIQPGMTSLDDFGVSAEDAAGAAGRAADDMLTFGDRIKGWSDKAMAGAREIGQQFGPLLTGVGAIKDLAGPLVSGFGGLLKDFAAKVLPQAAAAGLVTGTEIGVAQGEAQSAAATGTTAVSSMFTRILAMAIPLAPAGTTVGTAVGAAMAGGVTLGFVAAGVGILAVAGFGPQMLLEKLTGSDEEGRIRGASMAFAVAQGFADQGQALGDVVVAAIVAARASGATNEAAYAAGDAAGRVYLAGLAPAIAEGAGTAIASGVSQSVESSEFQSYMASLGDRAVDPLANQMIVAGLDAARALGTGVPGEIASGMQKEENKVFDAATALRDLLKNGLTPEQSAMRVIGSDYVSLVEQGMHSEISGAKETAQQVAIAAINTIEDAGLTGVKGQKGLKAIGIYYDQLLASGLTANEAAAALAAGGVSAATIAKLQSQPALSAALLAGSHIAGAWVDGLVRQLQSDATAGRIGDAAARAARDMKGQSPPKTGPLREIDKWGENVGRAWHKGVETGAGGPVKLPLIGAGIGLGIGAAQMLDPFGGNGGSPAQAAAVGGAGTTVNVGGITVQVSGASGDPQSIGDAVASKIEEVFYKRILGPAMNGAQVRWSTSS